MTRWMDYLAEANPELLWLHRRANDFGDWLSIDAPTPKDLLASAYWAYDAYLMAQMARALGRATDEERYATLFAGIRAAFNRAFVGDDGQVAGNTQTAYVLALHFDLLPEALRPVAARRLVDDIAARGGHLSTGFVGVGYLLPVLAEAGYVDVAYRLLLNETFPSWGYSIRQGATTIWERWDGWTEEQGFQDPRMNSFNHYSLGSVGQWLYQYAAGIDTDPERPGFAHILIRPRIGLGLTHLRAEYRSIRGLIVSEWTVADGAVTLAVTIPANTTATVYVPAEAESAVAVPGGSPHAAFLRMEGTQAVFAVESGSYTFTSRLPAAGHDNAAE
jgi:alpha-L-rhamnosidase